MVRAWSETDATLILDHVVITWSRLRVTDAVTCIYLTYSEVAESE